MMYGNIKCDLCSRYRDGKYVVPHCEYKTGKMVFDPVSGSMVEETRLIPVVFRSEYPNRNGDCKAFTPKKPSGDGKVTLLGKIRSLLCIKND